LQLGFSYKVLVWQIYWWPQDTSYYQRIYSTPWSWLHWNLQFSSQSFHCSCSAFTGNHSWLTSRPTWY
jgi:hypothetical protein